MKTKTVIWAVGIIALFVGGYYAYEHFSKKGNKPAEKKSKAAGGGCDHPDGNPPDIGFNPGQCAEYVWNTTKCDWECDLWWAADGFNVVTRQGKIQRPGAKLLQAKKIFLNNNQK